MATNRPSTGDYRQLAALPKKEKTGKSPILPSYLVPSTLHLFLELIPKQLVINIVVELDLRCLNDRTQQTRAAIR